MPSPSTARGDLWLYMNCALGVLKKADLQAWKQNPGISVTIRTFDALDGVRPTVRRSWRGHDRLMDGCGSPTAGPCRSSTRNVSCETRRRRRCTSNRSSRTGSHIEAQRTVRLPPLTRDLQIDYVGLSFVAPQKVRFRYRLDGRDEAWQEPGTPPAGVLQRSPPRHVPVPRDRQQQRRRLERARRVARDRHRARLVSDSRVRRD